MKIGWIGFHIEGLKSLQAVLQKGYHIDALITLKPEKAALKSGAADYSSLCYQYSLPIYYVDSINSNDSYNLLKDLSLDVAFVIGWSQIIKPDILGTIKIGMIGAHASLLPHNRGSAPINWALIRGETKTGNSLIWLADGVDKGDIISQTVIPITPYDTCETLYEKVAESNKEMILHLLPQLLQGQKPGQLQGHTDEPVLPRRRPEHGRINWMQENKNVYNFIRALTRPYPGALSWLAGNPWIIWHSALLPGVPFPGAIPGEIVGHLISPVEAACGQIVACGSGAIVVLELQSMDGIILKGHTLSDQRWKGKVWENET